MAERYDMTCDQGATFIREIIFTNDAGEPVDYTDWQAAVQVRKSHSDNTIIVDFTIANGRVAVFGVDGMFRLRLTKEETLALIPRSYVYDLLLISPQGNADRALEGMFIVTPGVTRVAGEA
jgi:hypothetical protein